MSRVAVQYATARRGRPSGARLRRWAEAVLADQGADGALTLRLVDRAEGADLNATWRGASGPTNVLSFPLDAPPGAPERLLGDIVLCAPVVEAEATAQGKPLAAHWAHMVVHGVLHLLGHDHVEEAAAARMERLEIALLGQLGYPDPYGDTSRA